MKSAARLLYLSFKLWVPEWAFSSVICTSKFPGVAGVISVQDPSEPDSKPPLSKAGMMGMEVAAGAQAVVAWQTMEAVEMQLRALVGLKLAWPRLSKQPVTWGASWLP